MKNMLTMVTSIVRQSIRSATSLQEAEGAIATRLIAMGKAHDLLLEVDWKTAKLTNVVKGALQQHNANGSRIDVSGPQIEIASAAILPLRLVMNELCTKATKYGALSDDKGLSLLVGTATHWKSRFHCDGLKKVDRPFRLRERGVSAFD